MTMSAHAPQDGKERTSFFALTTADLCTLTSRRLPHFFLTPRSLTEWVLQREPLQESTSHLEENGYFQPVVLDILLAFGMDRTSAITRDSNAIVEKYAGDSELEGLKTTNEGVADARERPHYYAANATAVPKQPKESKSGAQIKTSIPTEAEFIEKKIGECFTPLMTSTPKKKARKKQYESSEGNGTQDTATSKKKSRKKLNDISEDNGTKDIETSKKKSRKKQNKISEDNGTQDIATSKTKP
ncbi:hypothetical protein DPMN_150556 [Dreissena polymorpha]|uniref:Uncharacterized protein n=1 Tax=Dreissena polymorpha TaxID=45954 RepID=A0A9D4FI74_DREPO|nr:hypothetical protein DPMN_150556 [Dreissena polymorpha]